MSIKKSICRLMYRGTDGTIECFEQILIPTEGADHESLKNWAGDDEEFDVDPKYKKEEYAKQMNQPTEEDIRSDMGYSGGRKLIGWEWV